MGKLELLLLEKLINERLNYLYVRVSQGSLNIDYELLQCELLNFVDIIKEGVESDCRRSE